MRSLANSERSPNLKLCSGLARFGFLPSRLLIFTSAKEVMFLPEFVCLCVSKITQKVMDGSF